MTELDSVTKKKGLLYICFNARSVYTKAVNAAKIVTGADITGIVETWLSPTITDSMIHIPGYQLFRLDRFPHRNKTAGGLLLYLRDTYTATIDNDSSSITKDYEILCVDIEVGVIKYKVYVCYRPPDADVDKGAIYTKLTELKQPVTKNRKIIMMGDFNVNLFSAKDIKESGVDTFCTNNDLFQLISTVTRPKSGTLLDHFYTNVHNVSESGIINFHISDHTPIYMLLKCSSSKIPKKVVTARSYKNYDFLTYKNMLVANPNWDEIVAEEDPNIMWTRILDVLLKSLDLLCPVRRLTLPVYTPEWLTPPIIEEMKVRDDMYKRARRTNSDDDWRISNYYRNKVEDMVFNSRKEGIALLLLHRGDDPVKFWAGIRKLLPNKTAATFIKLKNNLTKEVIPPELCADYINKFFANVGKNLADALPANQHAPTVVQDRPQHVENDLLYPLSYTDMIKLIKSIKTNKPSSITHLKSYVLKDAFLSVPDVILMLYNKCLSGFCFPDAWKGATVIPLPKKANSMDVNDLRPISLLATPGKLLEKVICTRLQHYMSAHSLLTKYQHGYRAGHSTQTAINEHLCTVVNNFIVNKPTICLYLDYKKAFDTVSHSIMLKKLEGFGLSKNTCTWFRSYLTLRNQQTRANNCLSSSLPVQYGVPQGSVLGPVLFSIYINSLPDVADYDITLYADDAVLSVTHPDKMNECLALVSDWCTQNSLTVNEKKTKWMLFNGRHMQNPKIVFNNVEIERVYTFPYLGITLDPDLKFVEHRKIVVRNIRHKVHQLVKVRNYVDESTALTIYKTMVLPSFDYVDYIWDRGNVGEAYELQLLQNKALRCVYKVKLGKNPEYNTVRLHEKSKCTLLEVRREIHLLSYAHILSCKESHIDMRNLPTRLHDGKRLILPRSLNPVVLRSAYYRAIVCWNRLQPKYTVIEDPNKFKMTIKKDYPNCFV